jgi:ABC-2 type transport system permease protein
MLLYISIAKFAFLKYFMYPLEIIVYIFRYALRIGFIVLFWNILAQGNNLDSKALLSYFLLSTAISDIIMSDNTNLGRSIRKAVQRGEINNILIRPVKVIQYYYAETIGNMGTRLLIALITLIIGLILSPPQTVTSLVFTEVSGIKNAMHHVTRVLSGQMIPLSFFPEFTRNILLLTPFPIMIFGPINALSIIEIDINVFIRIALGFFWCILLNYLVILFWKKAIRSYDAAGN